MNMDYQQILERRLKEVKDVLKSNGEEDFANAHANSPGLLLNKLRTVKPDIRATCYLRDYLLSLESTDEVAGASPSYAARALDFLRGDDYCIFDPAVAIELLQKGGKDALKELKDLSPREVAFLQKNGFSIENTNKQSSHESVNTAELLDIYDESAQKNEGNLKKVEFAYKTAQKYYDCYTLRDTNGANNTENNLQSSKNATIVYGALLWRYRFLASLNDALKKVPLHEVETFLYNIKKSDVHTDAFPQNDSAFQLTNDELLGIKPFLALCQNFNHEDANALCASYASILQEDAPFLNVTLDEDDLTPRQLTVLMAAYKYGDIYHNILDNALTNSKLWNELSANDWCCLIDNFGNDFDCYFSKIIENCYSNDIELFKKVCKIVSTPISYAQLQEEKGFPSVYLILDWPTPPVNGEKSLGCEVRYSLNRNTLKTNETPHVHECSFADYASRKKFILNNGPRSLSQCYNLHCDFNWRYSFGNRWNEKVLRSRPSEKICNRERTPICWSLNPKGVLHVKCQKNVPDLSLRVSCQVMPLEPEQGEEVYVFSNTSNNSVTIPDFDKNNFYNLFVKDPTLREQYGVQKIDDNSKVRGNAFHYSLKCPYCLGELGALTRSKVKYQCQQCQSQLNHIGLSPDSSEETDDDNPFLTNSARRRKRNTEKNTIPQNDISNSTRKVDIPDRYITPNIFQRLATALPFNFLHGRMKCPRCNVSTEVNPICPHCDKPLPPAIFNFSGTISIILIGKRNTGKTTFRDALVGKLKELGSLSAMNQVTLNTDSNHTRDYTQGELPQATPKQTEARKYTCLYSYNTKDNKQILISLLDVAGEEFCANDANGGMRPVDKQAICSKADGMIVLVDPTKSQRYADNCKIIGRANSPSNDASTTEVIERLNQWITEHTLNTKSKKVPLALAMSKLDMLMCSDAEASTIPDDTRLLLPESHRIFKGELKAVQRSSFCRDLFLKMCDNNTALINTVENLFSETDYFALSALGQAPTADNTINNSSRIPIAVLDAFEWILKENGVEI